jgi:hypothetical protein
MRRHPAGGRSAGYRARVNGGGEGQQDDQEPEDPGMHGAPDRESEAGSGDGRDSGEGEPRDPRQPDPEDPGMHGPPPG